jgi:hypothetical protein
MQVVNQARYRRCGRAMERVAGIALSGSEPLFTAAFLRKTGGEVDVYERSPVELVGRGAGIVSHPELIDVLRNIERPFFTPIYDFASRSGGLRWLVMLPQPPGRTWGSACRRLAPTYLRSPSTRGLRRHRWCSCALRRAARN